MVILLNLGCIPDDVASKFDIKKGFRKEFTRLLEDGRKEFQKKSGVKWEHQSDKLLVRLLEFFNKRNATYSSSHDKEGGSRYQFAKAGVQRSEAYFS